MFTKILIANRAEIACRVIKTARRMGIATVAVYSDVDRDARHVAEADEAVHIGDAVAAQSYLSADKIIAACKQTGAEAVHPGYGFLSENANFARRLKKSGIVFIGPGVDAIEAMGDKITSKRLAKKVGVNTIPGHDEVIDDADMAVKVAEKIGYPVMLKASAGGGGKGMRIAHDRAETKQGFARASGEALSSFGDGRIFIEKFIEQPRHIEIQVIADAHGNVVTLNERECSIQRRHQKVIEEAPSPFIDKRTRADMSKQAIALAKAVDYQSAGTVEFIVDAAHHFYFLEMNTRLQVEHPVTEMITGLDLVELMIRVAAGEKLPIKQTDVKRNGWAMESRIYAENPARNFLPSIGRLSGYQPPPESIAEPNGECNAVRVDSGVEEGAEISRFYDPMIAKLVTWGENRDAAIRHMRVALAQYYIRGVETNLPFLAAIVAHPRFQSGKLTTDFIVEEFPHGFTPAELDQTALAHLICVMTALHYRLRARVARHAVETDWVVVIGRDQYSVRVKLSDATKKTNNIIFNKKKYCVEDDWTPMQAVYSGRVNGEAVYLQIEKNGYGYDVTQSGNLQTIHVLSRRCAELNERMPLKQRADQSRFVRSPMPGLLVSLAVTAGQEVKSGEEIAVIEAMKMENSLRADDDGVVEKVLVEVGATLEVDQEILEFACAPSEKS
ncbi:acetyl-CoA carboxylase biotin carboxylase subunit [Candidatus Spongiihabitans sp.]|uniref:acetyl-CoA carboxylase biotin carboxylase subunit n=1 Tax=Candidatus Spongiihabitans sp. TaxID=3101308 RepID=UPI003C7C278A